MSETKFYSLESHVSATYRGTKTHCTILYLGEQLVDAMDEVPIHHLLSEIFRDFPITCKGLPHTSKFGSPDNPVLVQEIAHVSGNSKLIRVNDKCKKFFYFNGIQVPNTYPDYRPHITVPELFDEGKLVKYIQVFEPHLVSWDKNA